MPQSQAKSKVLIVDDDEGLLILMAEALREEGFDVTTASSGAAAQQQVAEVQPDLMLLDLKLKDVAGAALLKKLRRDDDPVPFIVVTGQGDEKVAVEVMKQGALDYVMKDAGLLDLLPGVVRRALGTVERDQKLTRAQQELRKSEGRLSAALRATNDGVWEWDMTEDRVYYSARWKAILGFQPDEIADSYAEWESLVHPGDLERLNKAREAFLSGEDTLFQLEYRVRHKDGVYRWILMRAIVRRDPNGKPVHMTGANTDITERKELEKEVLRISDREQWRIGQELHDGLGQQLTAIEFMCQSLRSDLESLAGDAAPLVEQAEKLGVHLREAIQQTRSLAHGLTPFMLDASGLRSALAELAERTQSLGRANCRFSSDDVVEINDVEAAGHLFRIAQEAVHNALKYSRGSEISLHLSSNAERLHLEIKDNGKGLPKTHKRKDGIGLLVMRHRANAIGAELDIQSEPNCGVIISCVLRRV